jgi:hypothetical protein
MRTLGGKVPAATLSLTISGLSGCFSGNSVSLNGSFTLPRRIYTPMPGVTITVCDEWQYSDTFTDAGGITRTRIINVIRGDVWSIDAYGFYPNRPSDPYDLNDVFEGFSLAQCCESVAVVSNSICGGGTATITWDL